MASISTNNFKNGAKIELDGAPYTIVEFQHVKPGKGGAFVRTKLKNLKTGRVLEKTFRAGEKVDAAEVEEKSMQYLYPEGDNFCFMDNQTYEQTFLTAEQLDESRNFLQENTDVKIVFHRGAPIGLELPTFVEMEVVDTDPGMKGDTASGGSKPATLNTGAVVQVPLFINIGDKIRLDTRTGQYMDRTSG